MYIITCPSCGSQEIEETEYQEFKCKCDTVFDLEDADYEEA